MKSQGPEVPGVILLGVYRVGIEGIGSINFQMDYDDYMITNTKDHGWLPRSGFQNSEVTHTSRWLFCPFLRACAGRKISASLYYILKSQSLSRLSRKVFEDFTFRVL